MHASPAMTQQPPQSETLKMQDPYRQLPDKKSNTHAVKLTLDHVNFFYGSHQTLANQKVLPRVWPLRFALIKVELKS